MERKLTGDEVAQYIMKKSLDYAQVMFNPSAIPSVKIATVADRMQRYKRGVLEYNKITVGVTPTLVYTRNLTHDYTKILIITEAEVQEATPVKERTPRGRAKRIEILSVPMKKIDKTILAAIKVLLDQGVISAFFIEEIDSKTFTITYPQFGFVVKDEPKGIKLY